MSGPVRLPRRFPGISHVPYYAACSLLRMFIALAISTIFTFIYGTAAARLRRPENLLIAILQSVPIGFLTLYGRVLPEPVRDGVGQCHGL